MDQQLEDLRLEVARGVSQSDLIILMKQREMTILDAIKATRELLGISLGIAKQLVASHPAYRVVAQASEPLHNEIIDAFQSE
jgi:ribosomal protein L7/L12